MEHKQDDGDHRGGADHCGDSDHKNDDHDHEPLVDKLEH